MIKQILTGIVIAGCIGAANASSLKGTRFHDEANDTIKLNAILADAKAHAGNAKPEARIAYIGKQFLGTPYVAGTLDKGDDEAVTVNLDELDCTTYVETVLALAYTIGEGRTSWRDFVYNLERIRYRGGEMNGYPSRLHYASEWVIDNVHRGIFKEATGSLPYNQPAVKTIDFMSENRDKYAALKDSANYAGIKNMELGYRNHRFPYIKSNKTASKDLIRQLHSGDVVLITTQIKGLDVQHMGILIIEDNIPHLMHASSAAGAVVLEKTPLSEYLRKNRNASGIRIIRLAE